MLASTVLNKELSPVTIIDLEWQDSRLSWSKSDYDNDFIEVPGSSIWLPYFKIQAIVNEVDLKLRLVSDDYFIDVGDGCWKCFESTWLNCHQHYWCKSLSELSLRNNLKGWNLSSWLWRSRDRKVSKICERLLFDLSILLSLWSSYLYDFNFLSNGFVPFLHY